MTVQIILNHLKNDSGLRYLLNRRIYRSRIPQNPTYPLIMFTSSREDENTLAGSSGAYHYLLTFEVYAKDYEMLDKVVTKLKASLENSSSFKSLCTAEADDGYTDETKNYSIFLDYSIWF